MAAHTITWDELLPNARTGDLVLFHSKDFLSEVIEKVTGGAYSHVGMIIRPDPKALPLLWEESGVALAPDPESKTTPKHKGAQLGDLQTTVESILAYHDHPHYRRLDWERTPEFEAAVQDVITTCEGVPFGSIPQMAEHWLEGHLLEIAAPETQMFCSQLVALTFQRAGLLSTEHVPNWYAPSTFGSGHHGLHLLQGATFEKEIAIKT
ncbi:MAG: hypothetical protein ABL966_04025 [Acidimicrobiales bacterium]